MNIKVSTKTKSHKFCDVKIGTAFLHKSKPFMKSQYCLDPSDDDVYNAIALEEGLLVLFGEDEIVEPLEDAELILWR